MTTLPIANDHNADQTSPLIIERFLRDADGVWRQIRLEYGLNRLIRQMLFSSTVALAGYGAVMGVAHSMLQALASALKLPLLYLVTVAITLPTLYLFNLLCGGRLSARQVLALALAAITVTSALTLAFAPITLFFLMTAWNYEFYKLLNVAVLVLTGTIGLLFLVDGMRNMNNVTDSDSAAATANQVKAGSRPRAANMTLLYIWLALFGFVGTQLGWTLRPIFGDPGLPFQLFRSIESNFYAGVAEAIFNLIQGHRI